MKALERLQQARHLLGGIVGPLFATTRNARWRVSSLPQRQAKGLCSLCSSTAFASTRSNATSTTSLGRHRLQSHSATFGAASKSCDAINAELNALAPITDRLPQGSSVRTPFGIRLKPKQLAPAESPGL